MAMVAPAPTDVKSGMTCGMRPLLAAAEKQVPEYAAEMASCTRCLHNLWTETINSASEKRLPTVLPRYAGLGASFVASVLLQPPSEVPTLPDMTVLPERRRTVSSRALGEPASRSPQATAAVAAAGLTVPDALDLWKRICPEDSEFRLDAVMADEMSEMLQRTHEQAERWRQRADVGAWKDPVARQEREKVILWLFQVSDATGLGDDVIFTVVSLLDRLHHVLASDEKRAASSGIGSPFSQLTVLALLCTALKIVGGHEERSKVLQLREFLPFICRHQFAADQVFKTELAVLSALGFDTHVHTSFAALEALAVPLAPPGASGRATPVTGLAKFILQLSLLEPELQLRYPGIVLAASSLLIALRCGYGSSWDPQIHALLSDTAAICGQALDIDELQLAMSRLGVGDRGATTHGTALCV